MRRSPRRAGADPIDPGMRRMMDWDLYLRLENEGVDSSYTPVPVGVFRAHDTRVTATERRGFFQRLNLEDGFGREYDIVRQRYGAMRARRLGHMAHGVAKLRSGAYRRQLRARGVAGGSLRWFASAREAAECEQIVGRCYGGGSDRPDHAGVPVLPAAKRLDTGSAHALRAP